MAATFDVKTLRDNYSSAITKAYKEFIEKIEANIADQAKKGYSGWTYKYNADRKNMGTPIFKVSYYNYSFNVGWRSPELKDDFFQHFKDGGYEVTEPHSHNQIAISISWAKATGKTAAADTLRIAEENYHSLLKEFIAEVQEAIVEKSRDTCDFILIENPWYYSSEPAPRETYTPRKELMELLFTNPDDIMTWKNADFGTEFYKHFTDAGLTAGTASVTKRGIRISWS